MELISAIPGKQEVRNTKSSEEAVEVALTGEEAWLCLQHPVRRRLQRKVKRAVCNCLQLSEEVGNGFTVLQQEEWRAGLGKGK